MKRFAYFAALVAACIAAALLALPARAADTPCKPPDARYIHSGQLGVNFWTYWWCPDGATYDWTPTLPGEMTTQSVHDSTKFWLGLRPAAPGPSGPAVDALLADMLRAMALDSDRPNPGQWKVAKNGTRTTRPAYPVDDKGVRGTKSTERATVGAACDCATKVTEGSTTYCGVAPKLVAVCTKAP